ncbi:hypothetical protein [Streptomyces sp. NRRL S-1022]|uniref:hypothetical protein n=1 Tax=Streptomyces sp. NRRL S-1022 TaxID=1463880 RepID=UPI00068E3D99|nr:hypothetical protein [Streptomyces sp. NRRL S-1022]
MTTGWTWAFGQSYGVAADLGEHWSAGAIDPQLGRETFVVLGREPRFDEMGRLYTAYLWCLPENIGS